MRAPDFWGPGRTSFSGRSMAALLSPLGHVYGAVTASRARRPAAWEAPVPVICVGNAVMGGAGKTQVAIDLAVRLTRAGKNPHILTRGYGGRLNGTVRVDPETHTADDVGDEALLLAEHAPVWRGADRVQDAQAACDAGAGVIVMDDGFQNPALAKTLSLLVVDGEYGFGNGSWARPPSPSPGSGGRKNSSARSRTPASPSPPRTRSPIITPSARTN